MNGKDWIVATAMVFVIFCGAIYINDHVTCISLFGKVAGCAIK